MLCEVKQKGMVQRFIHQFIERAKSKDMKFTSDPDILVFRERSWEEVFLRCINQKSIEFVMLIDSRVEDSHGRLKYYEARHKVLTQVSRF